MNALFLVIGAIFGFLGVALGAFGAHGLSSYFAQYPDLQGTYQTAVQYHMYHALALLAVAWAADKWGSPWPHWAGYLFIAGILIFSGSLYVLVFTNLRWLGAITPIGGVAFLAGWVCLAMAGWRG